MSEPTHVRELKDEAREKGKDPRTRTFVTVATVIALLVMGGLLGYWINATFKEKAKSETLAQQIALACENGDFGPGLSTEDIDAMCKNAEKVIENQGEIQDDEVQESEIQEDEIQESEIQEDEIQQPENQQDESQDEETQESEIQEDEIQNEEVQDEEIDNPDPNDPPARVGSYMCGDAEYMQGFSLNPDGTVSYVCKPLPTMTPPGQQ